MSGITHDNPNIGSRRELLIVRYSREQFTRFYSILHCIHRLLDRSSCSRLLLHLPLSLHLLDVAGIGKHDCAELRCRFGRVDWFVEALFIKARDPSAMIDMCMSE